MLHRAIPRSLQMIQKHPIKTNRERVSDTVQLFPSKFNTPFASSINNAQKAVQQSAHVIENPAPASSFQLGDTQLNAINTLIKLFHKNSRPRKFPHPHRCLLLQKTSSNSNLHLLLRLFSSLSNQSPQQSHSSPYSNRCLHTSKGAHAVTRRSAIQPTLTHNT